MRVGGGTRISRREGGGGGSGSGRHQKVTDPALDVLLLASSFQSLNVLLLTLQELLYNPSICARASCGVTGGGIASGISASGSSASLGR